jgi:hypothetical protein
MFHFLPLCATQTKHPNCKELMPAQATAHAVCVMGTSTYCTGPHVKYVHAVTTGHGCQANRIIMPTTHVPVT